MGVTESESEKLLVTSPLAILYKLLFSCFEGVSHVVLDLTLEVFIDHRDEVFLEVSPAHRASHAVVDDRLTALEAHEVLAWSDHRLGA